jgi:SAM-dependent methyltransferase
MDNTQLSQGVIDSVLLQSSELCNRGDIIAARKILAEAFSKDYRSLALHNAREALGGEDVFSHWFGVNCTISLQDDIFSFFGRFPKHLCAHPIRDYLADGWRSLNELMLLLERVEKPLLRSGSVLEFASGHGRLTRHLAPLLGTRLMCCDVVPDAVNFTKNTLGVDGFISTLDPSELPRPRQFDIVFALSMLTHTPPKNHSKWVRAMYDLVVPGGVLIYSLHGPVATKNQGILLDEDGTFFVATSETTAIDWAEYGTSFCSIEFSKTVARDAIGREADLYAERAFWNSQDAMVICKP